MNEPRDYVAEADLQLEVESLRRVVKLQNEHIVKLSERSAMKLPRPHETDSPYWVVPLMVGSVQLSSKFDPNERRVYELVFVRRYAEDGAYWELAPLCTKPERWRP